MKHLSVLMLLIGLTVGVTTHANTLPQKITIKIYATSNKHTYLGNIIAQQTSNGVLFTPDLHDLTPGIHGFHIHEVPDCGDHGLNANGHFDPDNTNKHLGPYQNGHLGDLPVLIVNKDHRATLPVLAPRLTINAILNHAIMIHKGGDNYSDAPEKLGGGGKRVACGIIKAQNDQP
ncbi:superoxide dismutase family protein [Facilibium subflavum]|uniref:superoxide dismutase family protein n=1 Tax=Facilibium subflavum TaxID=2219058 RepID=UPI001AADD603|nr:superoxide dismutase family protein [Facilibium subflavum]